MRLGKHLGLPEFSYMDMTVLLGLFGSLIRPVRPTVAGLNPQSEETMQKAAKTLMHSAGSSQRSSPSIRRPRPTWPFDRPSWTRSARSSTRRWLNQESTILSWTNGRISHLISQSSHFGPSMRYGIAKYLGSLSYQHFFLFPSAAAETQQPCTSASSQ